MSLAQASSTGSIKEYGPVGDGIHMMREELPLLPLIERVRPRPHTLVRKVSVVGSHVLRYISRNNSLAIRRHLRQNVQRVRMARIDQQLNYANAYSYDQEDADWLNHEVEPMIQTAPGLLQLHPRSCPERLPLQPNFEDNSMMKYFNWRLYLGMMCIIVAQALLKLSFQEVFNLS
ncbi:hypothetical protein KR222_000616 [Zaprionus bogoriensis]|nr:hypothetical protein KR222_000616 [Zaprionus bogoriensis]